MEWRAPLSLEHVHEFEVIASGTGSNVISSLMRPSSKTKLTQTFCLPLSSRRMIEPNFFGLASSPSGKDTKYGPSICVR